MKEWKPKRKLTSVLMTLSVLLPICWELSFFTFVRAGWWARRPDLDVAGMCGNHHFFSGGGETLVPCQALCISRNAEYCGFDGVSPFCEGYNGICGSVSGSYNL